MEYRDLLHKFFAGEISDEELGSLKSLLSSNRENRKVFDEENELWSASGLNSEQYQYVIESEWNKIAFKVGIGNDIHKTGTFVSGNRYRFLQVAASVAILMTIGISALWFIEKSSSQKISLASTKIETLKKERSNILLPDSTMVILNSESALEYNTDFNKKDRVVKLNGEANFIVHTNPMKPFVVQINHISITATGTRFNVLSYNDIDRIETTLESGKVFVSVDNNDNPVELNPGQQMVYSRKSKEYIVREVSTEIYTSWLENKLRFIDTPFEEAMLRIARRYDVKIEIADNELLDLTYTATFIDESIEEVMEMLQAVSPITYKICYRTEIDDVKYTNPKIMVGMRKKIKN